MAFGDYLEAVKDEKQASSGTALSITFASLAEDNLVVIFVGAADGFTFDGTGYTEWTAAAIVEGVDEFKCYYKVAGASETLTVGATIDTSIADRVMLGWEVEGPFDATPLDVSGSVSTKETASSSVECPAFSPTVESSVAIAMGYGDPNASMTRGQMNSPGDNGFTYRDGAHGVNASVSAGVIFATKVLTSSSSVAETRLQFTNDALTPAASNYHFGIQANFKEEAAAAGGPPISQASYSRRRR